MVTFVHFHNVLKVISYDKTLINVAPAEVFNAVIEQDAQGVFNLFFAGGFLSALCS